MTEDNIEDGGPAFPSDMIIGSSEKARAPYSGMSLRDWFAGMAAQGLSQGYIGSEACAEDIAIHAYHIADVMLVERTEGVEP